MRLVTIAAPEGAPQPGAPVVPYRLGVLLGDDRVLPVPALAEISPSQLPAGIEQMTIPELLALDPALGTLRDALAAAADSAVRAASLPLADIRLGPSVPRPGKVICIGQNYMDHIREQGIEPPARPVLFAKLANAVIGPNDPIRKPAGTHALDLEAELAVVIGRPASRVAAADALTCVAGYTVGNDVTARDWQGQKVALRPGEHGDGQWLRAKSSDTFLPLGPVLVTADELGNAGRLRVRSSRTPAGADDAGSAGKPVQMQDGNTADMIFDVVHLIEFISAVISLEPGDVILTGTPNGVGAFRNPPVWLEPGDVATVEVEAIGALTNPVVDQDGRAPAGSPAALSMAERSAPHRSLRTEDAVTR